MPQWNCCDDPTVTYFRKEETPDGGTLEYYICLSCSCNHVVIKDANGEMVDQQVV